MKWEGICDVKNVSRLGFGIFVQWETFESLPFCKTRDLWEKQKLKGYTRKYIIFLSDYYLVIKAT